MKYINVFKTHFDIGFTDLAFNVVRKYGKMLERVADICEATQARGRGKRFVWTMAAWPALAAFRQLSSPYAEKVRALIKAGQIVIHALPFTLHTEFMSEGDVRHLFDCAEEFCETFGVPFPAAAKMTDVPGHTCALIAPLVKRGVRFLHLGANRAATKPDVPQLFWWEDPCGNRLLTFYSKAYGSSTLPPPDWKFPVWLSLQQTGDNAGPQDAGILDEIERAALESDPQAEVLFGSLDDFYAELAQCDLSGLPVVRGDLGDTWIHGVGSYPKEVSALRRARRIVERAGLSPEEERKFYQSSLLFTEHTWGCNMQVFMPDRLYDKAGFLRQRREGRYIVAEASWEEQRARARVCTDIAERYAPLYRPFPRGSLTGGGWKIEAENGLKITHEPSGAVLVPRYEYETIGAGTVQKYLDRYLQLVCDWSVADNGREAYHEKEDKTFGCTLVSSGCGRGYARAGYVTPQESYAAYGNAEQVRFFATVCRGKVHLRVVLKNKHASPVVEGGNLFIATNLAGSEYRVKKIDRVLDPETDIVEGANAKFFCVSDMVSIDGVCVDPVDSPLVSFGESAVYRYQAAKFRKPARADFVFNLFNNQWGTNFPQWSEADVLIYDYIISAG